MAQQRSKQRGVVNLVTCTVLLLLGSLGMAAGCSAPEDSSELESLGEQSQAQFGCACPADNPCATFTCSGTKCVAKVNIKEGEKCGGTRVFPAGVCHLNVCCPGCVVVSKGGPPECAVKEGTDNAQCGEAGTTCEDCTRDTCSVPKCDGKSCNAQPIDEGGTCTTGVGFCTGGECCTGCLDSGVCKPGTALAACGIAGTEAIKCKDCTDSNACTAEACVEGKCTAPASPPNTQCDDGDICNGTSKCSGTTCVDGEPLKCDDGDPCTIDKCDEKGGCIREPNTGAICNDGDPCTTGEKCDANSACTGGVVNKCDDNKSCTTDSCKNGACVNAPVKSGTTCNDGNSCTEVDTCNAAGECIGTGGPACDDSKPCTKNACANDICANPFEPITTPCVFDKCTQNSHCAGTSDACVAGTPIDCDDSNPCTADSCDPEAGCVNEPVTKVVECVDGDACTVMDKCVDGACVGTPMPCLALDACHEPGTCDPDTGRCDDPRAEDGKECPGGACKTGLCDPDAVVNEGGAAAGGAAGEGGAGAAIGAGAVPSTGGTGGDVAEPGDGGTQGEPDEGRPFVREPGGCSCQTPGSGPASGALWIAGLALVVAARRRRSAPGLRA